MSPSLRSSILVLPSNVFTLLSVRLSVCLAHEDDQEWISASALLLAMNGTV